VHHVAFGKNTTINREPKSLEMKIHRAAVELRKAITAIRLIGFCRFILIPVHAWETGWSDNEIDIRATTL
jgi:hypothetical protein